MRELTHLKIRNTRGNLIYKARLTWFETLAPNIGYSSATYQSTSLSNIASWAQGLLDLV